MSSQPRGRPQDFLRLPREIREQIYGQIFQVDEPQSVLDKYPDDLRIGIDVAQQGPYTAILRCNKQIYYEAWPVFVRLRQLTLLRVADGVYNYQYWSPRMVVFQAYAFGDAHSHIMTQQRPLYQGFVMTITLTDRNRATRPWKYLVLPKHELDNFCYGLFHHARRSAISRLEVTVETHAPLRIHYCRQDAGALFKPFREHLRGIACDEATTPGVVGPVAVVDLVSRRWADVDAVWAEVDDFRTQALEADDPVRAALLLKRAMHVLDVWECVKPNAASGQFNTYRNLELWLDATYAGAVALLTLPTLGRKNFVETAVMHYLMPLGHQFGHLLTIWMGRAHVPTAAQERQQWEAQPNILIKMSLVVSIRHALEILSKFYYADLQRQSCDVPRSMEDKTAPDLRNEMRSMLQPVFAAAALLPGNELALSHRKFVVDFLSKHGHVFQHLILHIWREQVEVCLHENNVPAAEFPIYMDVCNRVPPWDSRSVMSG